MADPQQFPQAGDYTNDLEDFLRRVASNLKGVMKGRTNNTGKISLTVSAGGGAVTTTDVILTTGDLSPTTAVTLMPTTATAASAVGAGGIYVSTVNAEAVSAGTLLKYSFRITHTSNDKADRTFRYVLSG